MASMSSTDGRRGDDTMYLYDMSHKNRGKCLIINNVNSNGLTQSRTGSDQDAEDMKTLFTDLGFTATIKRNKTADKMKKLAESYHIFSQQAFLGILFPVAADDHTDSDCVAVFILSHGQKWDVIDGTDKPLKLDDIFTPFQHSSTLVGKPKLFFIQACRGTGLDRGSRLQKDGTNVASNKPVIKIPQQADFLYSYSTPPGHYSFRRDNGSWFIQAIKKVFTEAGAGKKLEIQQLMTRVNHEVAYEYQSFCKNDPRFDEKKQVSSCVSMLTKELYFRPK